MKTKIFILLTTIIFVSCGNSAKTNENSNDLAKDTLQIEQDSIVENTEFQQYLSHFDTIKLPVSFDFCSGEFQKYVENSSFSKFENDEYKKFYKKDYDYLTFGKIITDNYIATITLLIGDCFAPILTTYSYNGKIIDAKEIFITDMNDEGHYSSLNTLINNDLSILITDSVTNYERDTISGEEINIEKYVLYQEGKLLPTGKIELSKMKRKELNNQKIVNN